MTAPPPAPDATVHGSIPLPPAPSTRPGAAHSWPRPSLRVSQTDMPGPDAEPTPAVAPATSGNAMYSLPRASAATSKTDVIPVPLGRVSTCSVAHVEPPSELRATQRSSQHPG